MVGISLGLFQSCWGRAHWLTLCSETGVGHGRESGPLDSTQSVSVPLPWACALLGTRDKANRTNQAELPASRGCRRPTAAITMERSTEEEESLQRDPELVPADLRRFPGGSDAPPRPPTPLLEDKWDSEPAVLNPGILNLEYLEDADEGLREVVEVAAPHLRVLEVVPAPEELHAQQRKDDDEEEEQQQQRGDGADGVEQGRHQIAQRRPVPEGRGSQVQRRHTPSPRPRLRGAPEVWPGQGKGSGLRGHRGRRGSLWASGRRSLSACPSTSHGLSFRVPLCDCRLTSGHPTRLWTPGE